MNKSFPKSQKTPILEGVSYTVSKWVSTSVALLCASIFLFLWLIIGLVWNFPNGWQEIITTTSAAVSLFMLFILTRAQAKDTAAMHVKLNEIIKVLKKADNELIAIENLTESEIEKLAQAKKDEVKK